MGLLHVTGEIPRYVPRNNMKYILFCKSLKSYCLNRISFLLVPVQKGKSRIIFLLTMAKPSGHKSTQLSLQPTDSIQGKHPKKSCRGKKPSVCMGIHSALPGNKTGAVY